MNQLVKKIFTESNFEVTEINDKTLFFERLVHPEYFIVDFVSKEAAYDYLKDNVKQEIIDIFESKKIEKPDVAKNTSLLICIKVDQIKSEIENLRNEIFKIEEDEFWFKKYVLLYTDQAVANLMDGESEILIRLSGKLFEQDSFENFKRDIYSNETYFLVVLLFLKLPFLCVPFGGVNDFQSLRSIIAGSLSENEMQFLDYLLTIEEINNTDYWSDLRKAVLSVGGNEELFDGFIQKYTPNVQD